MTNRTNRVITLLQTTGTWGTHVKDANTLNGGKGKWNLATADPADPNGLAIYKSLIAAAQEINLATNARVKPNNLRTIVSPAAAIAMSTSAEMVNYVRESPAAYQLLKGGFDPQFDLWGVPRLYRGFEIVVEDSPIVTANPPGTGSATSPLHPVESAGATGGRSRIKNDTTAIMVSRIGELDGEYGSPSFSTVQVFHYGGLMEVFAFDDPENQLVKGNIDENIGEYVVSNVSGYLINNIL